VDRPGKAERLRREIAKSGPSQATETLESAWQGLAVPFHFEVASVSPLRRGIVPLDERYGTRDAEGEPCGALVKVHAIRCGDI
jgi:hypothetical protein